MSGRRPPHGSPPELGHPSPFSLVPGDWGWWLENFRGHAPSIGWPETAQESEVAAFEADLAGGDTVVATDDVPVPATAVAGH